MTDNCPCCNREFSGLEDYPLILVKSFRKTELDSSLEFPFFDDKLFVEPTSPAGNSKAPVDVVKFFRERYKGLFDRNEEEDKRHQTIRELFDKKYNEAEQKGAEGAKRWEQLESEVEDPNKFKYKGWIWRIEEDRGENSRIYVRKHPNQRELIINGLKPYLDSLEGLAGKEITPEELFPKFLTKGANWFNEFLINVGSENREEELKRHIEQDTKFAKNEYKGRFCIPGSNYCLGFAEKEKNEQGFRVAELYIVGYHKERDWSEPEGTKHPEPVVGYLEYEGRIRK